MVALLGLRASLDPSNPDEKGLVEMSRWLQPLPITPEPGHHPPSAGVEDRLMSWANLRAALIVLALLILVVLVDALTVDWHVMDTGLYK